MHDARERTTDSDPLCERCYGPQRQLEQTSVSSPSRCSNPSALLHNKCVDLSHIEEEPASYLGQVFCRQFKTNLSYLAVQSVPSALPRVPQLIPLGT